MKILLFSILICLSSICISQNITYEQSVFDSDSCCWRQLAKQKEYNRAGQLIISYLKTNKNIRNKHSLNWHAGQMFALADNKVLAKKYMRKTISVLYKLLGGTDTKTWYYYAKGTIAFIDRDRAKLERIIKRWSSHYEKDKNFASLVHLLNNWNSSYLSASNF